MYSVLISGGTGSFGRAFVRKCLAMSEPPGRIIIYSRDEQKQEAMAREFNHPNFRFFIGDIRDYERLELAMRGVDVVVHAAALKIVPTCEYNPFEAVATNINGAENVARAALRLGISRVIALSTDKAVAPVNLYGATKLAAEKIMVAYNNVAGLDGTRYSVVRYGNVAGSRGSVIPFFKELRAKGEPLRVTDSRMTRYWISLDQAVDLVLLAADTMRGGEIFVPKMPSFRIVDLAEAIDPMPHRVYTGIRPGEKIHEDMISIHEARFVEDCGSYFVIHPNGKPSVTLASVPDGFSYSSDRNRDFLTVAQLEDLVA